MTFLNGLGLSISAVLLLQSAQAQPSRLGWMVDRLRAADIAQIAALAPQPHAPWVMVSSGPPFIRETPWYIEVFLDPDRMTTSVRRGRLMTVKTTAPALQATQETRGWQVERMAEYAQVPVRPDAARVIDGSDLNRPFRVHGTFSDDDLVELARLVRASPPDPAFKGAAGGVGSHVHGTWPIGLVIRRDDGSVDVSLLDPARDKQGQRVYVRLDAGRWTIVRTNYWVAN